MKKTIQYTPVTSYEKKTSEEKADLYIDSYGNDPYRKEGWVSNNNSYITLGEYSARLGAGEDLGDYQRVYTQQQLLEIFNKDSSKPSYTEIQATSKDDLAGIIYGYADEDFGLQKKLAVSDADYALIQEVIGPAISTTYLAELFVRSSSRGAGISSRLLDEFMYLQRSNDVTGILTRTTTMKPYPMQSFLKRGFDTIYTYPENDPRKRALFYKTV